MIAGIDKSVFDEDKLFALKEYAIEEGLDERQAERFIRDAKAESDAGVGIHFNYLRPRFFYDKLDRWNEGRNVFSPYHVPLDEINIQERIDRREQLIENYRKNNPKSEWETVTEEWEYDLLIEGWISVTFR